MTLLWVCPLCRQPLQESRGSLRCCAGHCFDFAREGYVNLMPVNRKQSREPGDSQEMVAARRRVHEADLFRPLVDELVTALRLLLTPRATVLDLGCGEGYYSQGLLRFLPETNLYGVDISKPAVRLAAKSCSGGQFAVASAFDVPLPSQSVGAVLSIFAPASADELRRLVQPEGLLVKVMPGPDHLWSLRERLYAAPRRHEPETSAPEGYQLIEQVNVRFEQALSQPLLQDLVAMTPYAHSGQRENKQALSALDALPVQADFLLHVYQRTH